MLESSPSRGVIALLAAYVVALQALLLPVSVAAQSSAGSGLCLSAASSGSHLPASDQHECPCAAGCGVQCCAHGALGPSQVDIGPVVTRAIAMLPAHFSERIERPSDFGPHNPRAPPAS